MHLEVANVELFVRWFTEYKVHSYSRNGLCVVGFMDDHYPVRSAFSLLNQVISQFSTKCTDIHFASNLRKKESNKKTGKRKEKKCEDREEKPSS